MGGVSGCARGEREATHTARNRQRAVAGAPAPRAFALATRLPGTAPWLAPAAHDSPARPGAAPAPTLRMPSPSAYTRPCTDSAWPASQACCTMGLVHTLKTCGGAGGRRMKGRSAGFVRTTACLLSTCTAGHTHACCRRPVWRRPRRLAGVHVAPRTWRITLSSTSLSTCSGPLSLRSVCGSAGSGGRRGPGVLRRCWPGDARPRRRRPARRPRGRRGRDVRAARSFGRPAGRRPPHLDVLVARVADVLDPQVDQAWGARQ